jgi:hypothetical protein
MPFPVVAVCSLMLLASATAQTEYKLLATNKTSTTQKEMQAAAEAGFRFAGVMGGDTSFGGKEVVTIMQRNAGDEPQRYAYKLLATQKTSTMQKELQQLGDEGYEYKGQTVFESAFGGREVVIILELDRARAEKQRFEYLLLATKKTSTMQKELSAAGGKGFEFVGVTVGETAFGGHEVVTILRRKV